MDKTSSDEIYDHIDDGLEKDRGIVLQLPSEPPIVETPGIHIAMVGARSAAALLDTGGVEDKMPLLIVDDQDIVARQILADLRQVLEAKPPIPIADTHTAHIDIPATLIKKPGSNIHRKSKRKNRRWVFNADRGYF